jgi:CheY-like chemotaxis protein
VSGASPNGHERSILIVEDDLDVREALTQVLEFEGYAVVGATNGQEALDHLRAGNVPSLILLDLMMPVMDGLQFRSVQMDDPSLAAIPVIVISADGKVDQKVASLGVAGYMKKPLDVDSLLAMIARFGPPAVEASSG